MCKHIRSHIIDDFLTDGRQNGSLGIGQAQRNNHRQTIQGAQLQHAHQVVFALCLDFFRCQAGVIGIFILVDELVGSLTQHQGLVQFNGYRAKDDGQRQQEPAGIGQRIAQHTTHGAALLRSSIRSYTHNAYSSCFIFSSSCC